MSDVPVEQLARDVSVRLREACKLQEAAASQQAPLPASEPARLRAILDRPEFAQARKRNTDLLQRLMRQIDAWLDGFFQSQGAQSFAVATRAIMLGLALAVVLWVALRLRRWRRSRSGLRALERWRTPLPSRSTLPPSTCAAPARRCPRTRGRPSARDCWPCCPLWSSGSWPGPTA